MGAAGLVVILICTLLLQNASLVRKDPSEMPRPQYENNCGLVINEVNLYSSDFRQFIELARYCLGTPKLNRKYSMARFALIFVDSEGYLVGNCKLDGLLQVKSSQLSFFTIGNLETPNIDFDIQNCELLNINPREQTKRMMPIGMDKPIGVGLLFNEKESVLQNIKLERLATGFYQKTKLTKPMENTVMRNLQDFYLIASGSPYVHCNYFNKFYSGYNNDRIGLLRDWQGNRAAKDLSLNRCSHVEFELITTPFLPEVWKYNVPTPGEKNKCRGGFTYTPELDPPLQKRPRIEGSSSADNCFSYLQNPDTDIDGYIQNPNTFQQNLQQAENNAVVQEEVAFPFFGNEMQTADNTCPVLRSDSSDSDSDDSLESLPTETPSEQGLDFVDDSSNTDSSFESSSSDEHINSSQEGSVNEVSSELTSDDTETEDVQPSRYQFTPEPIDTAQFEQILENVPRYIFDNCDHVSEELKLKIRQLKNINMRELENPDTCNWLELLPHNNKYRCKFCHTLLKQGILFDRPRSPLVTSIMTNGIGHLVGYRKKYLNKRFFHKHHSNPLHLIALEYFRLFDTGLRGTALTEEFEKEGGKFREYIKTTEAMVASTFQAGLMGLTFFKFPKLTELLNYFEINTGHLYQNPGGMKSILMSISDNMHKQLMNQLVQNQKEISMMIDTSTDCGAYATMSVLFRTYSTEGALQVYFYKLIEVTTGEQGVQLFDLFEESIKADGIELYLKNNLYGYTSDGAPNLKSVFKNKLVQFANNPIIAVHCGCHVIELINKHAYEGFDYLASMDASVNELVKFFNPKSAKRRIVLKQMTLTNKERNFELKRIRKIRWINSKFRSFKNIINHWKTIRNALEEISVDDTFKFDVRIRADNLVDTMSDGTWLITIAFLCDVSSMLSTVSVNMQKRGGTLIAKKSIREALKLELQNLRVNYGPFIRQLLEKAEFNVREDEGFPGRPTLLDIERSMVKIDGEPLNTPRNLHSGQTLYTNMARYIQALQNEVDNYYPEDDSDYLEILDASKFPANLNDFLTYGVTEILLASEKLRWRERWNIDDSNLKLEWITLTKSLFLDQDFIEFKNKLPEVFWTHFLNVQREVRWTVNLRRIISNIVTVACTSAEVERSYSLYSAYKTYRRFSLVPSTVDAMLRLRYNGGNLQDFDTLKFTKTFMQSHSRSDDTSRRETWKKKPTADPDVDVNLVNLSSDEMSE